VALANEDVLSSRVNCSSTDVIKYKCFSRLFQTAGAAVRKPRGPQRFPFVRAKLTTLYQ